MKTKMIILLSFVLLTVMNATAQNLLNNAGLESSPPNGTFPSAGWDPSWYPETAGSITTTTAARTGNCGFWIYTSNGTSFSKPSQKLNCTPGRDYKAEVYLRCPKGQKWTQGSEGFISLTFLGASNTELQVVKSESMRSANNDWTLYSVTGKAPVGSNKVVFTINLSSQNGQSILNADDCLLSVIR